MAEEQDETGSGDASARQRVPMLLAFVALALASFVGLLAPSLLGVDLLDGIVAICRFPR